MKRMQTRALGCNYAAPGNIEPDHHVGKKVVTWTIRKTALQARPHFRQMIL
jgi:hypothetical protein